jgi:parvulin-like peptidyl-prolyl isomerase
LELAGMTFEQQRIEFVDNILAKEYLRQNVQAQIVDPSREDLLAYYKEHANDYRQNAGAVWRHIEVKIGANPKDAADKTAKVMQRLQAGEDFATVAKQMSEDASAANGGLCPKTSKGSYAEEAVDQALFTMPVGRFSAPIRGRDAFHIVKVEARTADGVKPFPEVQPEILEAIKSKQFAEAERKKLNELRRKHYIESVFDRNDIATSANPNAAIR